MWGNLANQAKKLGANDFNATLRKLGDAVAPPPGEDDDDEDYEDDGEYYDDEDGEYSGEEEDGGGFGFVGLLKRALDDRGEDNDDDEEDEYDDADVPHKKEEEVIAYHLDDNEEQSKNFSSEGHGGEKKPLFTDSWDDMPTESSSSQVLQDSNEEQILKPSTTPSPEIIDIKPEKPYSDIQNNHEPKSSSVDNSTSKIKQTDKVTEDAAEIVTETTSTPTIQGDNDIMMEQIENSPDEVESKEVQQDIPPKDDNPPFKNFIQQKQEKKKTEMMSKFRRPRSTKKQEENSTNEVSVDKNSQMKVPPQEVEEKSSVVPKFSDQKEDVPAVDSNDRIVSNETPATNIKPTKEKEEMIIGESSKKEIRGDHENSLDLPVRSTQSAEKSWEELLERKTDSGKSIEKTNPTALETKQAIKTSETKSSEESETIRTKTVATTTATKVDQPIQESKEVDTDQKVDKKPDTTLMNSTGIPTQDIPVSKVAKQRQQPAKQGDGIAEASENSNVAKAEDDDVLPAGQSSSPPDAESLALREQLREAQEQILRLQQQSVSDKEESQATIERLMLDFQKKESRLLEAANEESQHETMRMQEGFQNQIHDLEERLAKERKEFIRKEESYRQVVENRDGQVESLENDIRNLSRKYDSQISQAEQRDKRSIRMAEDKVAQTMAILDERNDEINRLKSVIKGLESSMNEHVEGAEEAEEDILELEKHNESLQEHVGRLEAECAKLKSRVATLEGGAEQMGELQMELTLLREDRDRLMAKNQSAVESAFSSRSKLESERDAALAEVRDIKQQLGATVADLEVAQADRTRIITANQNLEGALEAFQNERQAELDMLEEQRLDAEEAIKSAHSIALGAIRQTHEAELKQVQQASDSAVKSMMNDIKLLEANLLKQKTENSQTRRSLDEAIHRLQTNQEDVIDRTLMKNILVDWCTMKDKDKRHQVLELMASVLHFTEEEREKVHLTHLDIESVRDKFVGAIAAPLPAVKTEKIKGNNLQEKWLSFLDSELDS